jgi:hypothetical protein
MIYSLILLYSYIYDQVDKLQPEHSVMAHEVTKYNDRISSHIQPLCNPIKLYDRPHHTNYILYKFGTKPSGKFFWTSRKTAIKLNILTSPNYLPNSVVVIRNLLSPISMAVLGKVTVANVWFSVIEYAYI